MIETLEAPLDTLLSRFEYVERRGHGYVALCPAHPDRRPSLSITTGRDGRVLLNCRAGCRTESVLRALGLSWSALFSHSRPAHRIPGAPIVCELDHVRHDLVARERRLAERRDRWAYVMELAAEACELDRLILKARETATALGDVPEAWDLEARAAELERLMRAAEVQAHLDVAGCVLW